MKDGVCDGAQLLKIGPVFPPETMKHPATRLEEGDQYGNIVQRPHARARIVAAAGMGPWRVTLLESIAERDDLGAPLRAAH